MAIVLIITHITYGKLSYLSIFKFFYMVHLLLLVAIKLIYADVYKCPLHSKPSDVATEQLLKAWSPYKEFPQSFRSHFVSDGHQTDQQLSRMVLKNRLGFGWSQFFVLFTLQLMQIYCFPKVNRDRTLRPLHAWWYANDWTDSNRQVPLRPHKALPVKADTENM